MNITNAIRSLNPFSPRNVAETGASPTPFGTGARTGTNVTLSQRRLNEMTPYDRRQAMRDSSFVFNRLGIGRSIVKTCNRYSIDGGLIPYSVTGDQAYDDSCDKFCDSIFESNDFDVTGEHDFYGLQQIGGAAVMVKGDCGVAKILARHPKSGSILKGPQLQMFQSEQIGDSGTFGFAGGMTATANGWREGIRYDDFGKRTDFRVLTQPSVPLVFGSLTQQAAEFKAADFLLWLDAERINQGRGHPWMQTGTGSAMRIIDLVELESKVALLNSYFGAYIKTPTGELGEGFENLPTLRSKTGQNKKTDDTTEKAGVRQYAEFFGGAAMPVLAEGEEIGFYKNERPSLTFTGFIDWLASDIAAGFGVPIAFVWAMVGRTGPDTRFIMNQGDWFFRHVARITISRFARPVREWIIRYGLLTGRINGGRPPSNGASPFLARWQLPRKASIDERYFFKTWMERIDKGLGTEEDFYADLGGAGDAGHFREQRAKEMADWMRLADKYKVPLPMLVRQTPGQNIFDPHQLADGLQQAGDLNA